MTPHPLVLQLRFTRREFQRALEGVTDEEARKRFEPMNSFTGLFALKVGSSTPKSTSCAGLGGRPPRPPLDEMWQAWNTITQAADPWLDTLTTDQLSTHMIVDGEPHVESLVSSRRITGDPADARPYPSAYLCGCDSRRSPLSAGAISRVRKQVNTKPHIASTKRGRRIYRNSTLG